MKTYYCVFLIFLLPLHAFCQSGFPEERPLPGAKGWGDTTFRVRCEIEYRDGITKHILGWKIGLKRPQGDSIIFLDEHYKIIPRKPMWESHAGWKPKRS